MQLSTLMAQFDAVMTPGPRISLGGSTPGPVVEISALRNVPARCNPMRWSHDGAVCGGVTAGPAEARTPLQQAHFCTVVQLSSSRVTMHRAAASCGTPDLTHLRGTQAAHAHMISFPASQLATTAT